MADLEDPDIWDGIINNSNSDQMEVTIYDEYMYREGCLWCESLTMVDCTCYNGG